MLEMIFSSGFFGGAVAQLVERATPGEEVPGSITTVAAHDRSHDLPALSRVWQHVKLSDVSLRTRPRYSLVVEEDVKKQNKPNQIELFLSLSFPLSFLLEAIFQELKLKYLSLFIIPLTTLT